MKKYSISFLLIVICIKLIYLYFEADYNGHLLDTVTDPSVSKSMFDELEQYGHALSAIGLTLLLLPFTYLVAIKYFEESKTLLLLIPFSILAFLLFYKILNLAIDEIVESNQDKRYNSYYTAIFKYGMLNNKMGYNSFIPNERLENLSVEDRVLISNMFLLTYADEELINRLVGSKDKLVGSFISKYHSKEYQEAESNFNNTVKEINDLYEKYKKRNDEINKKFSNVDSGVMALSKYQQLKIDLEFRYKKYKKKSADYRSKANPSSKKINTYYNDLSKYFKYSYSIKAKERYKKKMISEFGYKINPKNWCEGRVCPTKNRIRYVIKREAKNKWKKVMGSISPGLDKRSFFMHPETRKRVAKELRNKGLYVPLSFNYSRASFVKAYKNKIKKEFKSVSRKFNQEFKKKTSKNIRLGLNYNQFVYYWKKELIDEYGKKHGNTLYQLLKKKNTDGFYENFYIPYFNENYFSNYILTKEQLDTDEHKQKGNDAVKSLFVVPFAISMSLVSGVMNLISVIVLSLIVVIRFTLSNSAGEVSKNVVSVLIYTAVIFIPYKIGKDNNVLKPYVLLEQIKNDGVLKAYNEFLNWVLVSERFNYKYIYEQYLK